MNRWYLHANHTARAAAERRSLAPPPSARLAWTIIADPGTHTLLPRAQKSARAVGVVFTLGGMAFFALLIGLVRPQPGAAPSARQNMRAKAARSLRRSFKKGRPIRWQPVIVYDAFGVIGTIFRELDWKAPIFFEKAAPITPNAHMVE